MTMIDTRLTVRGKYTLCDRNALPASAEQTETIIRQLVKDHSRFGYEYLANCIELHALEAGSVSEAMTHMKEGFVRMQKVLSAQGLRPLGAGIHPLMEWKSQTPLPNQHNESIAAITPFRGKRFVGNGLHIYVSSAAFADDPEMMVSIMNQIRFFLPHLLALSASSPFWNAYDDSGMASYRAANLLPGEEMFGGMPHAFKDHAEYAQMRAVMKNMLPGIKMHADVSINSDRHMLEIRVMDMVPDFKRMEMLTSLCQCLVVTLAERYKQGNAFETPMWINRFNRGMAALYGTSDKVRFVSNQGDELTWDEASSALQEFIQDAVNELGLQDSLEGMNSARSPAAEMRDAYGTHMFDESPDLRDCLTATTEFVLQKSAEA